jgi:alpha-beta hydrolase superfamily lysophospholipase
MAAAFPEPPFLVGHSMGGLVVQKYLESSDSPGAVLMASIPDCGTIAAVARLAVRYPVEFLKTNLLLRLRPFVVRSRLVRDLFFTSDTAQEIVDRCFACLQDESYLAFLDTMVVLPRPHRVKVPVLVLGAEKDAFFTVAEVRSTARAYRTEAEIFPSMGHDMMLDTDWRTVADRIAGWLQEIGPCGSI